MFKTLIKYFILNLLTYYFLAASAFADQKIDKISIHGNKRIEASTVEYYLPFKKGNNFNPAVQNKATEALYSTSLFEEVSFNMYGNVLNINVKEAPLVSKIAFNGNHKIKSETLLHDLESNVGEAFSNARIGHDIDRIKAAYKRTGRFSTQVKADLERQENERIKITFVISEGPKTGIKNIYFIGNENYRSGELKSVILTKESNWLSFLSSNDTYDIARIEYDQELLKQFYQSVGYADFQVISTSANLSSTKEYFNLTFSIEEGDQYKVGKVEISNQIAEIIQADIEKYITVKTGEIYNAANLDSNAEKITDYLGSKGYPQVNIEPMLSKNHTSKIIDVTFLVKPAEKVYIHKILIEGNTKTEDHVIRRQFKIEEGDIFNRAAIARSEHNIRNLDYFEKLLINLYPTEQKDKYNINVTVEEKSTSSLNFDVGYNSAGGLFGQVSFSDRNIFGTGKIFNISALGSKRNTNYSMSITEPYFLDRELSLTGAVFKSYNKFGSKYLSSLISGGKEPHYKQDTLGFRIAIGYDISEDIRHDIDYSFKEDKLVSKESASKFLNEQIGTYHTSTIGHSLSYDQLDSRVIPKNGYILSASQEFAGLGGNVHYIQHELDGQYYKSFFNNKLTLKLSGNAGDIRGLQKQGVRIPDRFYLGDYSFYGFESAGIGPRDKITKEALGGQKKYTITSELKFPLGFPKEYNVSGVVFAKAGSLWGIQLSKKSQYTKEDFYDENFLRTSVGFGIIWVNRFAPLSLYIAYPIRKTPYDEKQSFHIKFSTRL